MECQFVVVKYDYRYIFFIIIWYGHFINIRFCCFMLIRTHVYQSGWLDDRYAVLGNILLYTNTLENELWLKIDEKYNSVFYKFHWTGV